MTSSRAIMVLVLATAALIGVLFLANPQSVLAPHEEMSERITESTGLPHDSSERDNEDEWSITATEEEPGPVSASPNTSAPQALSSNTVASRETAPAEAMEVASMSVTAPLMLKDVGEPFLEDFGLTPDDFFRIKSAGVDIIGVNFDMCADTDQVRNLLDRANAVGLKVVLPAGAGEAEWGFACDAESYPADKKYVWQEEAVLEWVREFKDHPALYAWDTSNEAGGNFPNARPEENDWRNEYALTAVQLQEVYAAIKAVDPNHPILIRMNGWFFYDYDQNFFRGGNPFAANVADIVMVNAYANVEEHFGDMVQIVAERTKQAVRELSPHTRIIVALGAWTEAPMWFEPTVEEFINDYNAAVSIDPDAVAVFKYGAKEGEWWMPASSEQLWNTLSHLQ